MLAPDKVLLEWNEAFTAFTHRPKHAGMGNKRSLISHTRRHTGPHSDTRRGDKTDCSGQRGLPSQLHGEFIFDNDSDKSSGDRCGPWPGPGGWVGSVQETRDHLRNSRRTLAPTQPTYLILLLKLISCQWLKNCVQHFTPWQQFIDSWQSQPHLIWRMGSVRYLSYQVYPKMCNYFDSLKPENVPLGHGKMRPSLLFWAIKIL